MREKGTKLNFVWFQGCPNPPTMSTGTSQCPAVCPVVCAHHEYLCPGMVDPTNNCPMPDMCRPKTFGFTQADPCPEDCSDGSCDPNSEIHCHLGPDTHNVRFCGHSTVLVYRQPDEILVALSLISLVIEVYCQRN